MESRTAGAGRASDSAPRQADIDLLTEELSCRHFRIFWTNRWLAVHDTLGGLLLAAVDAEYVYPDDTTYWYDPLGVWLYSSACPVEEDYCGLIERMALEVEGRDASVIVLDGNIKPLEDRNTYEVMVAQAHRYRFIDCEDVPLTWVQALIYRL